VASQKDLMKWMKRSLLEPHYALVANAALQSIWAADSLA
jgi:hypothetical protein